MSYGYRNTGLPSVLSYAQALGILKETKHIRGRDKSAIPLGNRDRIDQFSIRQNENGDVECVCYKTPVITYSPDGTVTVRTDNWDSVSTAAFLEEVIDARVRRFRGRICVGMLQGEFHVPKEGLKLNRVGNEWAVLNHEQEYRHKLQRKAHNNVRQEYADFIQYCMGMCKLREGGLVSIAQMIEAEGYKEATQYNEIPLRLNPLAEFFENYARELDHCMKSDKLLLRLHAFHMLVLRAGMPQIGYRPSTGVPERSYEIRTDEVAKCLDYYLIGFNRDRVLQRVDIPKGRVMRDEYAGYYEAGWERFNAAQSSQGQPQLP